MSGTLKNKRINLKKTIKKVNLNNTHLIQLTPYKMDKQNRE